MLYEAFALAGRIADCECTQGAALGYELLGFQPVPEPPAMFYSEKKSQYPADGAEYCDFTFLLYKSFLFDAFFYRLQYIVENHYIVQIITES